MVGELLISGVRDGDGQAPSYLTPGATFDAELLARSRAADGPRLVQTSVDMVVNPDSGLGLTVFDLSYILKVSIYISCAHCE